MTEAEKLAEEYAFQVPYDGTKDFYNKDKYDAFIAGYLSAIKKGEDWNDIIQIIVTSPYIERGGPNNYKALIEKLESLKQKARGLPE